MAKLDKKNNKPRENNYRQQVEYDGSLGPIFKSVSVDYGLGEVKGFWGVKLGYEDFNHILETSKGKYFVKIFGSYRDKVECKRYVEIVEEILDAGVQSPALYKYDDKSLYTLSEEKVNLIVLEYLDGKTFYELGRNPTKQEAREIIKEAAKINSIKLNPSFVYDEWAITSMPDQYEIVKMHLSDEERKVIKPLVASYKKINFKSLPYSLVHGDLVTTNVMKNSDENVYVIDFGCANYYPRVNELAVLSCDLLSNFKEEEILAEYQKHLKLTKGEIEILPLFIKMVYAMYLMEATKEKVMQQNDSEENEYWLMIGRKGLNIK